MAEKAAAALLRRYADRADIVRAMPDAESGKMVSSTVKTAAKCHAAPRRGLGSRASAAFRQTEAHSEAGEGYTVYFPPQTDIRAGDLVTVTHRGHEIRGRAGAPVFGALGVSVPLDGVITA